MRKGLFKTTNPFTFTFLLFLCSLQLQAQELFVYTEPASNMASKSIGLRLSNYLMKERVNQSYTYQVMPELMWGVSKKFMIHAQGVLNNRSNSMQIVGGSLYMKYRFYSIDEVHSHFRMAAYAKAAMNKNAIHQPAIDLNGYNSGYETGLIATQLLTKIALSVNASFLHATDNGKDNPFKYGNSNRDAIGYTFSAGKLFLPKLYVDYDQTNVNGMVEILGQTNLNNGQGYLDLAPSVQFIFLSKMRLDIGYRFPMIKSLERSAGPGFLVRFEYNFFNVYK